MSMRIPEAYEEIQQERVEQCRSDGYLLRHKKTGARVFLLSNEDKNKVFTIGFRTPPADSTGLPHILEHSVLCGSDKFPVKDPFIELEKSSLQTFLNAMTYPDKTIYPVASCNDQDFRNLMDVYMDAVLHPAIYQEEKIFRQEGWHYEMEEEDAPLIINGVVYNEMKGAFSSPEDVLDRYCQMILFPDTPYTHESGGDPEVIPTLSYEDFLEFHRTYYHPSNSYIYLYGDMDMEERLEWLDREYLSHYDYREVHSEIPLQKPFSEAADVTIPYPIGEDDESEDHTYLSVNWVTGDSRDPIEYTAFQILESVLLSAPGAPVKQALIDAGIGEDITGGFDNSSLQPYFGVVATNANADQKEDFLRIVENTLKKQVQDGIDRRSLQAAINSMDFKNREADFGHYPKGLIYGIECFDSWLYDASPMIHLHAEETFRYLREQMDQGYFEKLIQEYLLNNSHKAVITLVPEQGLQEKKDAELAAKLAEKKASMSEEEIRSMVENTRLLKEYQSEPSGEEQLASLPALNLSDIDRKVSVLNSRTDRIGEIPVLHQDIYTGGIHYIKVYFRVDQLPEEEVPYLGILRSVMGLMPTEHYTYMDLFSEINLVTGGIGFGLPVFPRLDGDQYAVYQTVSCRVLRENTGKGLDLLKEILLRTDFHDAKRLKERLIQMKTRAVQGLKNAGHSTASLRAASYASAVASFNDKTGGIDYLHFLEKLVEDIESSSEKLQELMDHLEELAGRIYHRTGMLVTITTEAEDYAAFAHEFQEFAEDFVEVSVDEPLDPYRPGIVNWDFPLEKKNEGFRTAGQIQYVAKAGNFRKAGIPYTGAMRIMRSILADEYLWINVRVKGGAYGCMCTFGRSGSSYLVSYRDPNLSRTLDVYEGIVPYLENFEASERDMNNYIIGTIGSMDHPLNACDLGERAVMEYMIGITEEMLQKERDEVLDCTVEDIRRCAPAIRAILDADQLCVVGNAGKLEEEKELFLHMESLN